MLKRHEKYKQLRILRADRHWTQWHLALKAKVNQSRISLIENGWTDPTDDEKESISKAFQLPTTDVFPEPEQVAS